MTIYHFANESIGPEFFNVFQKIKSQKPGIRFVLVFSSLTYSRFQKYLPFYLKRILKLRYKRNNIDIYDEIIISRNINNHKFSSKIKSQDLGFITGFNQILSQDLISRFSKIINFHPSLLPYYRGPVPSYWVLKNKERSTGFTIHVVTKNIDMGEILIQKEIPIQEGQTALDLDKKLSSIGTKYLSKLALEIIEKKVITNDVLDAEKIYINHVDYKSFPKNN